MNDHHFYKVYVKADHSIAAVYHLAPFSAHLFRIMKPGMWQSEREKPFIIVTAANHQEAATKLSLYL